MYMCVYIYIYIYIHISSVQFNHSVVSNSLQPIYMYIYKTHMFSWKCFDKIANIYMLWLSTFLIMTFAIVYSAWNSLGCSNIKHFLISPGLFCHFPCKQRIPPCSSFFLQKFHVLRIYNFPSPLVYFSLFSLLFASRHSTCSSTMCRGSPQGNASRAGAQRPQAEPLWGPDGRAILREAGPCHLLPSQLPHTWTLFHGILFLIFFLSLKQLFCFFKQSKHTSCLMSNQLQYLHFVCICCLLFLLANAHGFLLPCVFCDFRAHGIVRFTFWLL